MSITEYPIVAKIEECGDTRYYSNDDYWRKHYAEKYGEEAIGDMPTVGDLAKLQLVEDLFLGSSLESLELPPSDF